MKPCEKCDEPGLLEGCCYDHAVLCRVCRVEPAHYNVRICKTCQGVRDVTGTLAGYLVYRVQEGLAKGINVQVAYDPLIRILTKALMELSADMEEGQWIELPDGRTLTIGKRLEWRKDGTDDERHQLG